MRKIIGLFLAFIFALTGVGQSVIGYTGGTPIRATQHEYKFDKDTLLLGGYYAKADELSYAADAGLDFIISNSADKTYLDKAASLDIGIIAAGYCGLPSFYGNMSSEQAKTWTKYNYTNLIDHEALWGIDMIDEPDAPSYTAIQEAAAAFYANTEKLLPYVNLFPSYADGEQLGEEPGITVGQSIFSVFSEQFDDTTANYKKYTSDYINTIDTDYICMDYYPYSAESDKNGNTVKTTSEGWIRNLDILAEACRETDRDLWVIIQSAGETKDGIEKSGSPRWCEEKSEISQQVYYSLAFGAKAVIYGLFGSQGWWDTDSHMIGSDGKPTPTYASVKEVNEEIGAFAGLYGKYTYNSTYLLNGLKAAGATGIYLNCEDFSERGNIRSTDGLLVGTFDNENGEKAYIVVNAEELNDEKDAAFTFDTEIGTTVTVWQAGEKKVFTTDAKITLTPGEGVFITVQ